MEARTLLPAVDRFPVRALSAAAAVVAALTGTLVLAGWRFDIVVLKSLSPGFVAMNPATAVGFILAGASLWLLHDEPRRRRRTWGVAAALGVALLGLSKLVAIATSFDPGLDRVLFAAKLEASGTAFPNRIAPYTALAFTCTGLALATLDARTRRGRRPAELLIAFVGLLSLAATVGYFYGTKIFYGIPSFISMALHTALTFVILSVGALCARPRAGVMGLILSPGAGGLAARRLLPAVILVPLLLGQARLVGDRAGLYDTATGTSLMVFATTVLLAAVAWRFAVLLERADARRREAESENRSAHAFLDSIVENIPTMIFVKSASDLRFVRFNRAGEELLGHAREELLGKNDFDLFPPEQAEAFTAKDRAVLDSGTPHEIFEEPISTRTRGVRFLHTKKVPILDREGRSRYLLGISVDVTERKEREDEIRRLNARLAAHAAQVEAVNKELEAFAYSVSHDLRAPLRHIDGFVDLLKRESAGRLETAGERYVVKISAAARRMGDLIDELLSFSRMGRTEMRSTPTDLDALVREARAQLESECAGRDVAWEIAPLPPVQADPAMLRLVLVNLISNALKYTRTRSRAAIAVGAEERDGEVVVWIRDNGVGFDMRFAGKLFGVFQRLHRAEEFEGTGIGLANVRRIVQRHGGRTWAEAALDQGACFYFSLPHRREAA